MATTDQSLRISLRDEYRQQGFVIRPGCFTPAEIAELAAECDRLLTGCRELIDPRNLRCRYMPHCETGEQLFEVFDPVNDISPVCARFCEHPGLLALVEAVTGEAVYLFKEKLIFKPSGALGYPLHQDIPCYWHGFPQSFLTVLIPIDAATADNGCTEVFRGYHHDFLSPPDRPDLYMLPDDCVDPAQCVALTLQPGDVAIFHGLTPHRSAPNRTQGMRRSFYVSYNARSDGGDQRARHYQEFQNRMREHLIRQHPDGPAPWFR